MAKLINLKTIIDEKGKLTVIEKEYLKKIERVFYIYESAGSVRGGHRHKNSTHALVCLSGSCKVKIDGKTVYNLNSPDKCLIIQPQEWREMYDFSKKTVLLCISDHIYDPEEYIVTFGNI